MWWGSHAQCWLELRKNPIQGCSKFISAYAKSAYTGLRMVASEAIETKEHCLAFVPCVQSMHPSYNGKGKGRQRLLEIWVIGKLRTFLFGSFFRSFNDCDKLIEVWGERNKPWNSLKDFCALFYFVPKVFQTNIIHCVTYMYVLCVPITNYTCV